MAARDGEVDPSQNLYPVRRRLDRTAQRNDFDDWTGNRWLLGLLSCVSMIMAVSFKLMLRLAAPVAALAALAACGGHSDEKQETPERQEATADTEQGQPIYPALSQINPNDKRPIIAAFGDSISAGFGVEAGKSYPDDLQKLIDDAGYKYRVVNLGVSGDTTTDALERLPAVLAIHPALAVLEFGGNDGLRGLPVAAAKKNLDSIVEQLQAAHIQVLLAGMTLPRNYGPDYIQTFDQMYVDVAKTYKVARIPFVLDGVGGHADLTQADGIHPTAEGAKIVASNVMKYLQPLLHKS